MSLKRRSFGGMLFRMKSLETLTLSKMEQLLSGSRTFTFEIEDAEQKYALIAAVRKA